MTSKNIDDAVCLQMKPSVERQVEKMPEMQQMILLSVLKDHVGMHERTARSKLIFYSRIENEFFISELCKTGKTTTGGCSVVIFSGLKTIKLPKDPSEIRPVMRMASGFFNLLNFRRKNFLKRYHRSFWELFCFEILASPLYHSFRREVFVKILASGFLAFLGYLGHKFF